MFDVGFFELLLIGVVALLVVGPERLPKLAKTAGLWLGKGKRFLSSVKSDIEQELKADELKRILNEREKLNPLHDIVDDTKEVLKDIKDNTEAAVSSGKDKTASDADSKDPGNSK